MCVCVCVCVMGPDSDSLPALAILSHLFSTFSLSNVQVFQNDTVVLKNLHVMVCGDVRLIRAVRKSLWFYGISFFYVSPL